jgi:hypothetical protein
LKGFGLALRWVSQISMAASRSATLLNTPRRIVWRVNLYLAGPGRSPGRIEFVALRPPLSIHERIDAREGDFMVRLRPDRSWSGPPCNAPSG